MSEDLHHLAILFPGPITITSRALSLYDAQALKANLEQRVRTQSQPIITIPMGDDRPGWPINTHQAITWAICPKGGTTPW